MNVDLKILFDGVKSGYLYDAQDDVVISTLRKRKIVLKPRNSFGEKIYVLVKEYPRNKYDSTVIVTTSDIIGRLKLYESTGYVWFNIAEFNSTYLNRLFNIVATTPHYYRNTDINRVGFNYNGEEYIFPIVNSFDKYSYLDVYILDKNLRQLESMV